MDFNLSEDQNMVAEMVRKFAAKHIKPKVMEWDEAQHFPVEVFKEMGKLGLLGVLVPTKYGGAGFGYLEYVSAIVELSKVCGSIGLSMGSRVL